MGVEFVDTGGVEPSEPQGGELLSITDSTHGRRAGWPGSGFRDSLSMGRHLATRRPTTSVASGHTFAGRSSPTVDSSATTHRSMTR